MDITQGNPLLPLFYYLTLGLLSSGVQEQNVVPTSALIIAHLTYIWEEIPTARAAANSRVANAGRPLLTFICSNLAVSQYRLYHDYHADIVMTAHALRVSPSNPRELRRLRLAAAHRCLNLYQHLKKSAGFHSICIVPSDAVPTDVHGFAALWYQDECRTGAVIETFLFRTGTVAIMTMGNFGT